MQGPVPPETVSQQKIHRCGSPQRERHRISLGRWNSMPEPLWVYLRALLYFTNITTCSAIADALDSASHDRLTRMLQGTWSGHTLLNLGLLPTSQREPRVSIAYSHPYIIRNPTPGRRSCTPTPRCMPTINSTNWRTSLNTGASPARTLANAFLTISGRKPLCSPRCCPTAGWRNTCGSPPVT